ncbi:hypothetical protein PBY51_018322 [Eleginops maclovinus]|uniref:Uncharacterized protein n=1 Tax=Eleginops maclovinus TaxID=56733 RepID=A0AAN7Y9B0_ELEMC|nr:hypothetical protein PBY51_018322 [Eleginops maclovinus]
MRVEANTQSHAATYSSMASSSRAQESMSCTPHSFFCSSDNRLPEMRGDQDAAGEEKLPGTRGCQGGQAVGEAASEERLPVRRG